MTGWIVVSLFAILPFAAAEFHMTQVRVENHDYEKHRED